MDRVHLLTYKLLKYIHALGVLIWKGKIANKLNLSAILMAIFVIFFCYLYKVIKRLGYFCNFLLYLLVYDWWLEWIIWHRSKWINPIGDFQRIIIWSRLKVVRLKVAYWLDPTFFGVYGYKYSYLGILLYSFFVLSDIVTKPSTFINKKENTISPKIRFMSINV